MKTTTTPKTIEEVMANFPTLTRNGFDEKGSKARTEAFLSNRVGLCDDESRREVLASRFWIRKHCKPLKGPSRLHTSYGIKHIIEKSDDANPCGHYVSNGACIAAFVLEGYALKIDGPDGMNCFFNATIYKVS